MDKIYSRTRFPRIIYIRKNGNKPNLEPYKNIIITIIIVIIIGYFTAIKIIEVITPVIERQCRVIARSTASQYSNEACNNSMQNLTYEDLCTIERDESGIIRLIKMNVITVNKLNSQIALEVQNKLNNSINNKFYIALGTFTGSSLLCGRGPNIEVRMSSIGDVTTNIKSQFEETGVNQTLHRIYININCNVSLLTPFKDVDEKVTSEVLLAETVISGEIPQSYYDLEGMSAEDTVNMME